MTPMIGAATNTDRAIVRTGIAALAGVNRDVLESAERAESHLAEQIEAHDATRPAPPSSADETPEACPSPRSATAARCSAANVASISAPPALCTHLPTLSPRIAISTSAGEDDRADERREQL